jgi:hypothetical protein
MVQVADAGYGYVWEVIDTLSNNDAMDAHIFRDATSRVAREVYSTLNLGPQPPSLSSREGRRGRLPSLHEMWTLWECEQALVTHDPHARFLDPREFYWLGDALGIGRYLLCSVGSSPIRNPRVQLLNEVIGTRSSETFCLYEFRAPTSKITGDDFGAIAARIVS